MIPHAAEQVNPCTSCWALAATNEPVSHSYHSLSPEPVLRNSETTAERTPSTATEQPPLTATREARVWQQRPSETKKIEPTNPSVVFYSSWDNVKNWNIAEKVLTYIFISAVYHSPSSSLNPPYSLNSSIPTFFFFLISLSVFIYVLSLNWSSIPCPSLFNICSCSILSLNTISSEKYSLTNLDWVNILIYALSILILSPRIIIK